MKITIPATSTFLGDALAKECAQIIYGRVVEMHLRRSWGLSPSDQGTCPYGTFPDDSFAEVKAAISSISNSLDRINFVASVRFHFQKIRDEWGIHVKWQDYVASVKAYVATTTKREVA